MRKTSQLRDAEAALGAKSRRIAEAQLKNVGPDRLSQTISDYIEWRIFAYWVRLVVETQQCVSAKMEALLEQRCPGFLDSAEDYRRAHPKEREFLWLRLISWIDDTVFGFAKAEGWPHALVILRLATLVLIECALTGCCAMRTALSIAGAG
jgi:hypothetical protein